MLQSAVADDHGAEHAAADRKRWCVVVDTNQWISHLMLRSPTAAAVLYSLRQQRGVIGLPFVIEEELKRLAFVEGVRARDQITTGLDRLQRLVGSAPRPHTSWGRCLAIRGISPTG